MRDKLTFTNGKTYLSDSYLLCGDYVGAGSIGVANIRVVLDKFEGRVEQWTMQDLDDESKGYPSRLVRVQMDGRVDHEWQHRLPEAPCLHATASHGQMQVWLLAGDFSEYSEEDWRARRKLDGAADEILPDLAEYPVLDDARVCEVETEWEKEAWESWLRAELLRRLPDDLDEDPPTDEEEPLTLREWAEDLDDADLWSAYRAAMQATNTCPLPEYSWVHVEVDRIARSFSRHMEEARAEQESKEARQAAVAAGQIELLAD